MGEETYLVAVPPLVRLLHPFPCAEVVPWAVPVERWVGGWVGGWVVEFLFLLYGC